jgi:alpha-galactosidase
VIAVDQDPLGRQGHAVASADGHWVLTKPLANGDRAVLLFNQTDRPATISTTVEEVGLTGAHQYTLLDLWSDTSTETTGVIKADVPVHGVVFYRITKGQAPSHGA